MATKQYFDNTQANEAISKFKLLSAYGGPGSIVHTAFGSIIVSCIEEWGFLKKILDIHKEAVDTGKKEKEINESIKSYRAMYQTAKENVQMLERIANSMLSQSDKLKELDIDPATIQSIKDQARKHLDVANRLNKLISKTTANF